jgi:hypothetical protein
MEIDDAYLGGELSGGKAGRGSENKVPFIAAAGAHERIVTGGGKASVKLPQFRAVNTVLSNLNTAPFGGPTTRSTSSSTPRATSPKRSTGSTGGSICIRS